MTAGTPTTRVLEPRGDRPDDPQPRLPRLDAARGIGPTWTRARRRRRDRRRRDRSPCGRDRAGRDGEYRQSRLRARVADAGARVRARRGAPSERGPLHRHPQRARHSALGSGNGPRPGGDLLGRESRRQDDLPSRPPDARRLRPGGRRPGPRDDRPARSAEGLRSPRQGGIPPALERGPHRRPRQRRPNDRRRIAWPRGALAGPGRTAGAIRSGDGPPDLRGRRLLPDAIAVRAVRSGPDDCAPLRHAADRPANRWPGRLRRRRAAVPGRGHGLRVRSGHTGGARRRLRACDRRRGTPAARPGTAWSPVEWPSISTGRRAPRRSTSTCTGAPWRSAAAADLDQRRPSHGLPGPGRNVPWRSSRDRSSVPPWT